MSGPKGNTRVVRAAAAVVVAALTISAIAEASGSTRFAGTFSEETGAVSFKLKRSHGKRTVAQWTWKNLPVVCDGESRETSGYFLRDRKPLPVEKRKFDGRAVLRERDGTIVGKAKVTGEFAKGFETADGLFRVTGRIPEDPETFDCDSGLRNWSATEGIRPARR